MRGTGLVLREGLVFGLIAGVFAFVVRLIAVQATSDLSATPLATYVTNGLILLIVGGAARKLAASTRTLTPSVQMGALAGGISELIHSVVANIVLTYLPAGRAAFAHLSPAARREAADMGVQILTLGADLALAVVFGALIGWLGAWSLLRFGPPGNKS